MSGRFTDWVTSILTRKSTTIDGTEDVVVHTSGLPQKSSLSDVIRYGGGNSTRVTTIGNANIHQKSDGTMWLEVTGQTAGNARGAGAFDWQAVRQSASHVASGAGAIALGGLCVASGNNAVAIGQWASASNLGAVSFGGYSSGISAYSALQGNAAGAYSLAIGSRVHAINYGQIALGFSGNADNLLGQYQANIQTFRGATTDASATVLNLTGTATDRMVIPAMRACAITGLVTAMSDATDGYKVKAWEIKCIITRDNSNNTRIVGTPIITELGADTEAAGWAITSITADNTNESLSINVTGEAATNIRWQASLFYSQVGH